MKADDKEDDVFDEVNLDDDREIFLGEKSSAFAARRSSGITSESGSTSDDSKKEKESAASVAEVFSFANTRKIRLLIAGACLSAVVSGATLPAMAFFFAKAFEDLARSTNQDAFISAVENVAYAFMILGVIVMVFMTAQATLMETAAGLMTHELKTSWFRALLRQDMAYYDMKNVTGEATLISTNGKRFRKGVGRKLSEAVQFTVSFVGALGYAFWASWQVTLAVLALSPLLFLSTLAIIKVITSQTSRTNKTYAKAGSIVSTSVTSIRTILSLNAVQKMIGLYEDATAEACDTAISYSWVAGAASASQFIAMILAYILVDLFGAWLLYRGVREDGCDPSATVPFNVSCDPSGQGVFGALFGVSFGAAVLPQVSIALQSFAGSRSACYPAIVAMSRQVNNTTEEEDPEMAQSSHSACIRRELAMLPKYQIDVSSEKGLRPAKVTGQIEFKNVCFSFPARREAEVLQNFSLRVDAGKTVALVGASGSGKSTVVQLLERFYDPTSGSILLDGTDLKSLNVKWLREQLGLVLQEPKLFGKSIRENISLSAPGITQEQIEKAARMANAHDFIVSFPGGYDTQVGDLGSQLSGGQKQRIAIARVLVKNPKILLLDEATSALDSESEASVQEALDGLMKLESSTTIVIAHRLSTIKNADMIAVVKNGAIVETGTHEGLIAKGGVYKGLVDAQKTRASVDSTSRPMARLLTHPSDETCFEKDDPEVTAATGSNGNRRVSTVDPSGEKENALGGEIIRFTDVRFRYPARPDIEIFRGLNLTVRQGETLALVGPSGSGKSTVIALLEAFYRPTEGTIEYHGVDLKEINVRWFRGELGLVSQEATLFSTTIEENIRYGRPEATMEQVIEAAKEANCHDFIVAFPDGYKTQIGEGGSLVSGGQKQRIAIARAIIGKPKVLLLDEATSALDSESEKIVQVALDKLMQDDRQTCIVIAHRLSTIRNADRIAVIDEGKVREIGTHEELMAKTDGRYRRLQELQNLEVASKVESRTSSRVHKKHKKATPGREKEKEGEDEESDLAISKEEAKLNSRRAWLLGKADWKYVAAGFVGAVLAGLFFPAWGVSFAFMTELLYQPVFPCPPTITDEECQLYRDSVANDMQNRSLNIFYGFLGLCFVALVGNIVLFWGFGSASERMNKRVRDSAFNSLLRQEVAWFDVRAPGTITSHLADDAAILHAFAGEPIRTLTLSVASVVVGIVISFVFMWPFALLTLAALPFLAFGAEMEMRTYLGEDQEDDAVTQDEHSSGGIVVETLSNMRTVASLTLEGKRADEYDKALHREEQHPIRTNFVKGSMSGLGQFLQMWCFALMFWWGGWLLFKYSDIFSYRDYLISLWGLFFSMYGLTIAFQGAIDREKAKMAAHRIFTLIDRQSEIDPLSEEGKKDI